MSKKALIAMSGGVDSSVAAYLMVQKGYDCMGITLKLHNNKDESLQKENSCCTADDIEDAKKVCSKLGIEHHLYNFTGEFEELVINYFIEAYEKGYTPNPCIQCNRFLKFEKLLYRAKELGYDYVVTGHYAKVEFENGRYLLKKADDPTKDQSYVLHTLSQEQLSRTLFPLGTMKKTATREIANEQDFINANKKDSQDICFAPDGDYAKTIKDYSGRVYPTGDFVDKDNNILGKHKGIIHYTIGQRKGLGLSLKSPLYVGEKSVEDNKVILVSDEELFRKDLKAEKFNWIAFETPPKELRACAKIRYRHTEQPCTVYTNGKDEIELVFDEPQRAISPGQAVVLYDGDTVLGGGTIC